ncbi:MAG: NfeD family protein [Akkermansia sp.]
MSTLALLSAFPDTGSFLHWMLAIGITLLLLDVFFNTELLSWLALVIFAAWGTWLAGLPLQWSVLVFCGFLALAVGLYFTMWNQLVRPFVMRVLLRSSPRESIEALSGRQGCIIGSGEQLCVRIGDQIFPLAESCRAGLAAGDTVRVLGMEGAAALVEKQPSAS